ncbi:protein of unknown function [Pseudodesulfovibrio piezophilus C1TLV30]|uniref:Uncharacterized protein n=1 Tax=Pseudodesulfovibrio piezophilus (strain DSM 21447 / JCM 15486 / C1TLV30) TaxID=1322246 RepID=M1WQD4_PSEP2|nr:protein of unknown function [Pseudodesulfovibrio piezophilus C1TLV30]
MIILSTSLLMSNKDKHTPETHVSDHYYSKAKAVGPTEKKGTPECAPQGTGCGKATLSVMDLSLSGGKRIDTRKSPEKH